MAKLYEAEGEQACPEEENCQQWLSSAEDQPPEARCPSCPKRGKSEPGAVATGLEDEPFIDVIEYLVRERDSGFGFPEDLTELEKQLVMVWSDVAAAFERAQQVRLVMLFEALLASGSRSRE